MVQVDTRVLTPPKKDVLAMDPASWSPGVLRSPWELVGRLAVG